VSWPRREIENAERDCTYRNDLRCTQCELAGLVCSYKVSQSCWGGLRLSGCDRCRESKGVSDSCSNRDISSFWFLDEDGGIPVLRLPNTSDPSLGITGNGRASIWKTFNPDGTRIGQSLRGWSYHQTSSAAHILVSFYRIDAYCGCSSRRGR